MAAQIDPADYAVISQALTAAAREAGSKLVRSAHSTIVREARDCAAAILDRHGNVIAQSELIPIQLGSIGMTFRPCIERFPSDTLEDGDFLINNDPYSGAQHLQDVFIYSPIFHEGAIIGFAATVAHHLDLGGGSPGINATATDLYQEGLIIPPSRYNVARDWNGGGFERLIAANIRVPAQTIGDFNAQFAANHVAVARVRRLAGKYGAETVAAAMAELLDYAERRVRSAIAEVPDGIYVGEDAVDDDGIGEEPLAIRATVTVSGDSIAVDYAGTCAQVRRNINAPFASTVSATLSCIKAVLTGADIPFNEGAIRPVTITAPEGSLLNPRPPAPVRARMEPAYRCFGAVMRALSEVVPDRVIAAGYDTTYATSLSHLGENGYRMLLEITPGGFGASADADGCDAVAGPLGNCANTPVEVLDMEYDFIRVAEYGLREGSAGAGRSRGGVGVVRIYDVLQNDVNFAIYTDRVRLAPRGLYGGADGATAGCFIVRDGERIEVRSKDSMLLRAGDRLVIMSGGGGGYGPTRERPAGALEADLAEGLTGSPADEAPDRD